ncbi:unnamed protein product [Cochlearia groenlandica]
MYFFGLSKEQVLSQKHDVVVSYKETCKQNQINMVTLFGKQVYPVKKEIFKRNPKIVIDLEEPPPTENVEDSVSYVTMTKLDTKPSLSDRITSKLLKPDQSLAEDDSVKATSMESGLLDLNSAPDDEFVSEPRYCFIQDLNCAYIEESVTSCEKSGIDDSPTRFCSPKCQNVHEKDGTLSPGSYTSCCTTENNPRTESRRSSSPRALEPSCQTRLEFPATEVLQENRFCNREEELSESIQMAAESLVQISTVSYQNQDLQSKPVSRTNSSCQDQDFQDNKPEKSNTEQRCCSYDSFELHTLGISETNTEEDFCVSSMALDELNNITRDDNREIGLKLRRGRRMKNFQKEILPTLASLSRHEIREDINILEAVFRSREYKKFHGKTKDVKFGTNQRNKRSGSQRYVGKSRRKTE